jgi:periplasmic divalent cation tolerance protein
MSKALVIFVTVPTRKEGKRLAMRLVQEGLAACVNIVPGIESHYRWQGRMEKSKELLLLVKSSSSHFKKLEKRIRQLHRYNVPEVLALPVAHGSKPYLSWLKNALV